MKNRYGVDESYFRNELATLSNSLPNRTSDELYRYLLRLAEVAKPLENIELAQQHLTKVKSSADATVPQMPPSCEQCPVNGSFCGGLIGSIRCQGTLWRHFF